MIVGFVGLLASGKSTAAHYAARLLKCKAHSLGDEVRLALRKKKIKVTREALQTLSAAEKRKHGNGVWARRLVARINKTKAGFAVVEGFRNLDEVRVLRRAFHKKFILVAVTAPIELRFKRAKKRMRESEKTQSLAAFKKSEALEVKGKSWGITRCIADADEKIDNSHSACGFRKRIETLVKRLTVD